MEDSKTTPHPKQNKNLKEVPIGGKFDTAGLLYPPYSGQFDEQTKTLHLTDNTLRDIVRGDLLSRAVIWLLGYDARKPIDEQINDAPIRAQAEGSHWEAAWCVIRFLDARSILADKYPSIVSEIERRLGSNDPKINPLVWLLAEAIDQDEEQIYWYGKEYDTAVVTLSLLRAKAEYRLKLPAQFKTELDQKFPKALQWLYAHLEDVLEIGKLDEEAVVILEPLMYADEQFAPLLSKVWSDRYSPKCEELYNTLDKWLLYLEAHILSEEGSSNFLYSINTADCLCRLILTCQNSSAHSRERLTLFAERAKTLLLHYIEFHEDLLVRDQWGGTLNQARQLSAYVEACVMTGKSMQTRFATANRSIASTEVVLKVLSMLKNMFFTNGSMYHSVYSTIYFLHSLISIWNWPDAEKSITYLYHDLLDKSVIKLTGERKENFELRRLLIERDRELANEKERYKKLITRERKKRYGLLAFVFVSLSVAVIFISYLVNPQNVIGSAGLVMTALAIVLTLIEVLFLRES